MANRGYRHDRGFYNVSGFENYCSSIRARHEGINRLLKSFSVLQNVFRHPLCFHFPSFHAVSNVTLLMIEHEKSLLNQPYWSNFALDIIFITKID